MKWFQQNAGGIQAIATTVLVAVTGIYAFLTWRLAQSTREEATATRAQAEASRALVEVSQLQLGATRQLAEETGVARILSVMPFVMVRSHSASSGPNLTVQLSNEGVGTAFHVELQWLADEYAGGFVRLADVLRPREIRAFTIRDSGAQLSVLSSSRVSFRCRYWDALGGHYETETVGDRVNINGLTPGTERALRSWSNERDAGGA